jgi:hypothetical protein
MELIGLYIREPLDETYIAWKGRMVEHVVPEPVLHFPLPAHLFP